MKLQVLVDDVMKLQVLVDDVWEYVFCYSGGRIITTNDKRKSLLSRDLIFFQNKFGNNEFRIIK